MPIIGAAVGAIVGIVICAFLSPRPEHISGNLFRRNPEGSTFGCCAGQLAIVAVFAVIGAGIALMLGGW